MVQWLRLRASYAGGPGSIPGQGTRSHMPQLKILQVSMKIPHATTKTRHSQINIFFKIFIYLAVPGLSCGSLAPYLRHVNS